MCLPEFDLNIRSKVRIMDIIETSIRLHYTNNFWIWYAKQLKNVNYSLKNVVNIVDFYKEIVGATDFDTKQFQLKLKVDIRVNTQEQAVKKWVDFILNLPPNPMINHSAPSFINPLKITDLMFEMVPKKSSKYWINHIQRILITPIIHH